MIHVHASNRMEVLAEWLAKDMRKHPADPLDAERVVVPHPLLGEWLRLELAKRLGVAGHLRIELPAEFAWSVMREALPDLPLESAFEPAVLRWRIFDVLCRWDGDDPVKDYLADSDSRKRFELADKLAAAYDRCMVFRHGVWNADNSTDWHVRLWSLVTADIPDATHWVDAVAAYGQAVGARESRSGRPRVYLFGIATLSPSYLALLRHISIVMDVHIFLLSPTRAFWKGDHPHADTDGYYAEGNELVATWGRLARDMQALVEKAPATVDRETYGDANDTRLGSVQRDIVRRISTGADSAAAHVGPDDTIQVHACHSATRELEVLHDRLLGLFDRHPDIQPADVLVLTPDLDAYAPVVEAVFGAADTIPFNIGRQRARIGTAINAFLDLLALAGSRYTASQMLAPLRAASVRESFGLEEGDLGRVREWVQQARIRWGMDATHCIEQGVSAPIHNNWEHGLRRLLLGYAIPDEDVLVNGVVPCGLDRWGYQAGAGDYERLGRFLHYCELASELNTWAADEHTPDAWAERLHAEVLSRFFVRQPHYDPDSVREIESISRLIDDFAGECAIAGGDIPVPFEVLRESLVRRARVDSRATPRLADGVTVASLATGQIFPAKVVCVLGMNDGAFPRLPPPALFDFMDRLFGESARQPGDRDVRDENRFAFLEALLAARRCFLVSYTGRDLMEDKPIPPSTVVSELTDYLHGRFPEDEDLEIHHPLQPFSRRYFTSAEPNLFSYSQAMANAADVAGGGGTHPRRFSGTLPPATHAAATPAEELQLDDLIRFSASPAKYFLRNRLGIYLGEEDGELNEHEPFELDGLETWELRQKLFEMRQANDDYALLAATGQLPPGNLGRIQFREKAQEVEGFATALKPYEDYRADVAVDITLGGNRIIGRVPRVHAENNALLWRRVGRLRPKDQVEAWLLLLALTCQTERCVTAHLLSLQGDVKQSVLTGPDPDEARSHLRRWIEVWRDGQRRLLPFFPATSLARISGSNFEDIWSRGYDDGLDAYHELVFGLDPFGKELDSLAQDLLQPLKEATQ
ncbi:MAG: exodeoxyribonuclease V subunit gamma [Gammaproteobacteria bacterium]|nr:exodeoxyribonuclease V subunit gamma [Gammaproteobacteria bacterium]